MKKIFIILFSTYLTGCTLTPEGLSLDKKGCLECAVEHSCKFCNALEGFQEHHYPQTQYDPFDPKNKYRAPGEEE